MGADRVGAEPVQGLGRRLQDRAFLQHLRVVVGIGAEQQPRRRQFGGQQGDARLLVQGLVVGTDPGHAQKMGNDAGMDV